MSSRSIRQGILWGLLAAVILFHVAGGWYFSGELIADAFEVSAEPFETTSGDYELEIVEYSSPLGVMDAWFLPAAGDTWVIHVHGKGANPGEAEPLFSPLQNAGYPQLAITYRNDAGQPVDPSGYYGYGVTEWEDVEAAVEYAKAGGAERIVLSGFSSGSAHALSYVFRTSPDTVVGILMDSPNIDFGDTVDFNAAQRELPGIPVKIPPTLSGTAKFLTSLRIGVNWKSIDYVDDVGVALRRPVLVHHGNEDLTVPMSQSLELADAAPDLVQLIQVDGAGHVGSYDVELEQYAGNVLSFLQQID